MFKFAFFLLLLLPILAACEPKSPESVISDQIVELTNETESNPVEPVTVLIQDLQIPWGLVFMPDGQMLVTQRSGRVDRIDPEGQLHNVATINEVAHIGEGGLLGIALHPEFSTNNWVYLYYTYSAQGNNTLNRVSRYTYTNQALTNPQIIINAIPGASNHNGGRLKFGPDRYLYITTGDASEPSLAQDTNSLAGKILRVTDSGQPAPSNPFNNPVYSYGHRNPQGLAWHNNQLWSVEHGPRGNDELNQISPGGNYGWPTIVGTQQRSGMQTPVVQSGLNTWAPGGLAVYQGVLYFTGLRGNALYAYNPEDNSETVQTYFRSEFGRLRELVLGPDNLLYMSTSNLDGRGTPKQNDDQIIQVDPQQL